MATPSIERLKQDIIIHERVGKFDLTLHSTWGLFSPEKMDEGTRLLLDQIKVGLGDVTLDLGCGYGPIGLAMAKLSPMGTVHLVDKDFVAVEYAKKNARINGLANVEIYLSNGFSKVPNVGFDNIISNLPAKVSGELLTIWLNEAKEHMRPGGKLWVVTVSGLKDYIKRNFQEVFGNYDKLKQSKTYTVAVAVKDQ